MDDLDNWGIDGLIKNSSVMMLGKGGEDMGIEYANLKDYIVKNYKEKLNIWFSECDKNDINDLDKFDLLNIATDFKINIKNFIKRR